MSFSVKAMWQYRCPKCRDASSSLFKKPFHFKEPLNMNHSCDSCGQSFEPEPGYYYGAMFISYLLSTFLLLPIALVLVFYFEWKESSAMIIVILTGLLLFFRILRMSRSLWIHAMVKYNPGVKK